MIEFRTIFRDTLALASAGVLGAWMVGLGSAGLNLSALCWLANLGLLQVLVRRTSAAVAGGEPAVLAALVAQGKLLTSLALLLVLIQGVGAHAAIGGLTLVMVALTSAVLWSAARALTPSLSVETP